MKKDILKSGFLKEPAGPSRLGEFQNGSWNNQMRGDVGPIVCEACLKRWPKADGNKAYSISTFMGLQIVEECCGTLFDKVYLESGEVFAIHKLEEVKNNPRKHMVIFRVLDRLFPGFWELLPKKIYVEK